MQEIEVEGSFMVLSCENLRTHSPWLPFPVETVVIFEKRWQSFLLVSLESMRKGISNF